MVIIFWVVAFLTIIAALTVILHKDPVYSALALVFTLFQVAVLFLLLEAYLVAFLQVIVYAGAIVVLFLFVIMLLSLQREKPLRLVGPRTAALVLSVVLALELAGLSLVPRSGGGHAAVPTGFGSAEAVAETLFRDYLLAFELTSVLLLAAVVGAVVMARRRA